MVEFLLATVPSRTDRTGGGTTTNSSHANGTVQFLMMHFQAYKVIVISVYRLPAMDFFNNSQAELDASAPNLVMVEDFHFPNINWQTNIGLLLQIKPSGLSCD